MTMWEFSAAVAEWNRRQPGAKPKPVNISDEEWEGFLGEVAELPGVTLH